MSKTYAFLLRWLPQWLANCVLVVWYLFLMLAIILFIEIRFDGFVYWGN